MSPQLRALYQFPYDSWRNRIATLRFVQDIPLAPGDNSYALVSAVAEGLDQSDHSGVYQVGQLDRPNLAG